MPFTEAGLAGVQTERDGGGSATPGGLARRRASRGGGTTGLLTWSPQAYLNMRTDPTPTTKGSAKATGRDMGVVEPRQKGPTPLTPGDRQRKEMLDPQKPHGGLNEEQTGTQPAKLASPWADLASIYKATSPPSPIPSTARAPCGTGLSQASAQGPNTGETPGPGGVVLPHSEEGATRPLAQRSIREERRHSRPEYGRPRNPAWV